jgi:hypothetical protein
MVISKRHRQRQRQKLGRSRRLRLRTGGGTGDIFEDPEYVALAAISGKASENYRKLTKEYGSVPTAEKKEALDDAYTQSITASKNATLRLQKLIKEKF